MPRKCSACINPVRPEIDRALLAGTSLREISRQVALSKDSIARHRPHVERVLVQARKGNEARHADALSQRLEELSARARRLADTAEARKDTRDSLLALREMSRLIEIEARIAGRIEGTRLEVSLTNIKVDLLTDEQSELSAGVRKSEKVSLRYPIMPIANGIGGGLIRVDRGQLG